MDYKINSENEKTPSVLHLDAPTSAILLDGPELSSPADLSTAELTKKLEIVAAFYRAELSGRDGRYAAADLIEEAVRRLRFPETVEEPLAAIRTPVLPGQRVWLPDGRRAWVDSMYVGKKGVQRFFVTSADGTTKTNCTPNGLNRDFFLEKPARSDETPES